MAYNDIHIRTYICNLPKAVICARIMHCNLLHLCVHVADGTLNVQYARLKKSICTVHAILCDDHIITVYVPSPLIVWLARPSVLNTQF